MAATSDLIARNVRRIRVARKMSQAGLAEKAGMSKGACLKIEKGMTVPRVDTLDRIAGALGVEIWQLIEKPPKLTAVRFRSRKKMRTREEILIKVARKLQDFNELEELLDSRQKYRLAAVAADLRTRNASPGQRPIEAASKVRQELGLTDNKEVILDICGLLESRGIKIFRLSVASEEFFGLSVGESDGGPAIVVNVWDRFPVERWIFTVAHELGHLILHQDSFDVGQSQEVDKEEDEANRFASHFLMPDAAFDRHLKNVKGMRLLDALFHLKRIFMVSYKVIVMRLIDKGLADKTIWREIAISYKSRYGKSLRFIYEPEGLGPECFGLRTSEIVDHAEPHELDLHDFGANGLTALVWEAVDSELINVNRAAEILDLDIESAREWAVARRRWNGKRQGAFVKEENLSSGSKRRRSLSKDSIDEDAGALRKKRGRVLHR